MVVYTSVLQFFKKNGQKKKKKMILFLGKKPEKQNIATIMKYLDGKGTVFPIKLKLQGEWFE